MKKLPLPKKDPKMAELIESTDHKQLAAWGICCMKRFMPYLDKYDTDISAKAIFILTDWIDGKITMWAARKYCWQILAFARDIEEADKVGCQIVRALSHMLAICHVKTHAEGVTIYTISSLQYQGVCEELVKKEKEWQINLLENMRKGCDL